MQIEDEDDNNLTKELLAIGANRSPWEMQIQEDFKLSVCLVVNTIVAHWSPLRLKIIYEGKNDLDNEMLTFGVNWSWRL